MEPGMSRNESSMKRALGSQEYRQCQRRTTMSKKNYTVVSITQTGLEVAFCEQEYTSQGSEITVLVLVDQK